ncbi:MAG: hypothetical protein U0Z53_27215 [Blastocatellia bacterium]
MVRCLAGEWLRQVKNEAQRREMALHFILLGALRFNHADLLELVSRDAMINRELLRESVFIRSLSRKADRTKHRRARRNQWSSEGSPLTAEIRNG